MPRRLLSVRQPCFSRERLCLALEGDQNRPNIDEIIESQDQKLQEVKRSVFNGLSIPIKLIAEHPIPLSSIFSTPSPVLMISTHYNDQKQSVIQGVGPSEIILGNDDPSHGLMDTDIDFSKAENLFLLETPIDARKDHNMLKLAYTIPKRNFMSRLMRKYPINRKRLAFIQRRPAPLKSIEMVGNLIVSGKGSEAREVTISCQVCGQKFGHQHQFQRHILVHPDPESKKFLCQTCGKRFNRADHLNRHAILHGEIKVQKCLLCGEEFDRASHLDRHRRKHHPPAGQQPSQTPPSTPQLTSPPPPIISANSPGFDGFMSNIIGPQTPVDQQSSGHNLHLLAAVATPEGQTLTTVQQQQQQQQQEEETYREESDHPVQAQVRNPPNHLDLTNLNSNEPEPERPYPCKVCGRKFIRATHLRRHTRIHTGEKPFACHICGRRYARGDYLRAHIHAHRRDKIHKCKHCGEIFHDLTRFADHCRLLHKDLDDQFGNPKPPPESSPPPPSFSTMLESSLTVEEPNEITVVNIMNIATSSTVPITLVTYPEPSEQDISISPIHHNSHSSYAVDSTPNHTSEAHLQALTGQADNHLLQNGHLQIADTANEVTVFSHSPCGKTTPISYMDSITQYIYSNSSADNMTTAAVYPPQPTRSPLMGHHHHPHAN